MSFRIATTARMEAILDRMARSIAATWPDGATLVGIRRRGVPLAERLATRLEGLGRAGFELQELELKRYTDDLDVIHEEPRLREPEDDLDLRDQHVLLVDDVLYSGRTLAKAMAYCVRAGAAEIRCAVVASREGQEVPITADFVGLRFDAGEGMIIEVRVPPYEEDLAVDIRRKED